ncbi:T9SS type B sorting domain-containing protein [Hymenobacter cheonanensis]|uniref:T9SS type B sorting domain-containing protein n=1 Tax=Hymenobacter sp. CA2-7 TaxID=3063993 RepID=UPI002713C4C7|nr:gliding motility-associated C-terminal domain-containing protein [Hymenobacter sp. CA2-7]MDO7886993.1 gliding motility-associated C-terminal domain-containing protein [Hymenobacter sp. CA2-7]
MLTYEGCTSLSDASGQLLAYSNGESIWDSQHQMMPNGTAGLGGNNSTSQAALLLPKPGDPTKAYLFCLDAIENNLVGGLRYSVVDFSLRGGLGDITATKGVILPTPTIGGKVTEKLAAVRHANGHDYWIVVHGWQSNAFYSFLFSSAGVSSAPVTSNVGAIHQGGGSFFGAGNAVGCMKASPDGRHLALAQRDSQCELYDFDNATGSVSNYVRLASHDYTYGVEFSPDNSKVYTTYSLDGQITQYNLLAGSAAAIVSSATLITSAERLGNLVLGPDNKIYVVSYGNSYLHVIDNPNATGTACNYKTRAVTLAGKQGLNGLPNFANTYAAAVAPTPVPPTQPLAVTIPNIITPNGDLQNEFFALKGLTPSDWHLSVFDRWGRQVYDQARYDNSWNAAGQAGGLYYYQLSNEATGERYRGWVEVMRGS